MGKDRRTKIPSQVRGFEKAAEVEYETQIIVYRLGQHKPKRSDELVLLMTCIFNNTHTLRLYLADQVDKPVKFII